MYVVSILRFFHVLSSQFVVRNFFQPNVTIIYLQYRNYFHGIRLYFVLPYFFFFLYAVISSSLHTKKFNWNHSLLRCVITKEKHTEGVFRYKFRFIDTIIGKTIRLNIFWISSLRYSRTLFWMCLPQNSG